MKNAFTVDLEDWYQGVGIPTSRFDNFGKRIRIGSDKILNLLAASGVKATFFVLGKAIEDHPNLIQQENRRIVSDLDLTLSFFSLDIAW